MAFEELKKLTTGKVNGSTFKEIIKSCREGEKPRFILGEDGYSGVLVAFDDRCIVIKKGLMTSFMTSSIGGGRTATFLYTDITGIEYSSKIVMGVLEILTASYSGRQTNSFWAVGAENDAWKLSNTLPWSRSFYNKVRTQIEWIQKKVQDAKSNQQNDQHASSSVADELRKLADLHKQAFLSDAEFTDAKNSLLRKL